MSYEVEKAVKKYVSEALTILNALEPQNFSRVVINEVSLSGRMTRSLGVAKRSMALDGNYRYSITISSKIFKSDSRELRETVFHEVAHVADAIRYNKMGHGPTWQRIMRLLGMEPDVYASKEKLDSVGYVYKKREVTRYVVACSVCGKEYSLTTQRMKKLSMYRCQHHNDGVLKYTGRTVKK